jgi:hypothetical protein
MIKTNKKETATLPPVFIIGAGRSGTTLLYKMLCLHSDIAWISNYCNRFPNCFFLSFINRISHILKRKCHSIWFYKSSNANYTHRNQLKRLFPSPVEGEIIYTRCGIPAFPDNSWNINNKQKKCIISSFEKMRFYQGASVFLTKRTANNRRIAKLIKIFPNAKFIHIIRDGRAVAFSLINVDWWNEHEVWWWGRKTPRQWKAEGNNPLEMAARNWVEEIDEIQNGLTYVPEEQLYEIRYEELPTNYLEILTKIINFIGLYQDSAWIEAIMSLSVINKNKTWHKKLNKEEQVIINNIQSDTLKRLGYV